MTMSHSRAQREMMTAIGLKIGKRCHISSNQAAKDVIPYIRIIFQTNEAMKNGLSRWFDFDEDMVNYLSANK